MLVVQSSSGEAAANEAAERIAGCAASQAYYVDFKTGFGEPENGISGPVFRCKILTLAAVNGKILQNIGAIMIVD